MVTRIEIHPRTDTLTQDPRGQVLQRRFACAYPVSDVHVADIYTLDMGLNGVVVQDIAKALTNPVTQQSLIRHEAGDAALLLPPGGGAAEIEGRGVGGRSVGAMHADSPPTIRAASSTRAHPLPLQGGAKNESGFDWAVEVGFLPGVTDNVAHTTREIIEDLTGKKLAEGEGVYSAQLLLISGPDLREPQVMAMAYALANPLIQRVHIKDRTSYKQDGGMAFIVPQVHLDEAQDATDVSLDVSDTALADIGKKGIANAEGTTRGPLGLSLEYMQAIQGYFAKEGRSPRDIELETLAQTWSEHCKHTIFASPIDEIKDGIYKHYIKRATEEIRARRGNQDICVSVFKDNAGAIIFDDDWLVTDKVETHNSPSALDPFGGAITGIVGVNRDALGFGMGAKPVLNRYGFCFADPRTKPEYYRGPNQSMPLLSPATIMEGVVHGVNVGGNCSGIATPQGFAYFDARYVGKPLVFVGTIGLIPRCLPLAPPSRGSGQDQAAGAGRAVGGQSAGVEREDGPPTIRAASSTCAHPLPREGGAHYPSHIKSAQPGDAIVMLGGRVGKDGIHGATFSSEALDEGSPATAVQIGDPITQKKFSDAIVREARDLGLYHAITDNGAGGLSSSVGEMAEGSGGFHVQLEAVPLKYPGMAPWEIWISESQERMTLAVPQDKVEALIALMQRRGVEASVIGEFTDSSRAQVSFHGQMLMDIDMEFLHDGLPEKQLTTTPVVFEGAEPDLPEPEDIGQTLVEMLGRLNICSKEFIATQYDHEVQGISVLKPLQGKGRVYAEATVSRPVLDSMKGVVTAQGLVPRYSDIDCYAMAAASMDMAVRNAVAAGGDLDQLALCDNFCWCDSTNPERLYQLKEAARACYEVAVAYGTPFISGKDSMFNDFRGYDAVGNPIHIAIPPTLLVSALGVMEDITRSVSLDAKFPGDLIYVIGETRDELGGSEYYAMHDELGAQVPQLHMQETLARYRAYTQAVQQELIASGIAVNLGGLGVALAKTLIGGQLGAEVDINAIPCSDDVTRDDTRLFSETLGRFLVTVAPQNKQKFEEIMGGYGASCIGEVSQGKRIIFNADAGNHYTLGLDQSSDSYKHPLSNY